MICRFYEFNLENGYPSNALPSGIHECGKCDKKSCVYCHDINLPLTKHKFSWILSRLFEFPIGSFQKGNLKDTRIGIRLIHPQDETIWVMSCISEEKENYYVVVRKKLSIKCKTIEDVNSTLKSDKFNYEGREIHDADFNPDDIKRRLVDVHN